MKDAALIRGDAIRLPLADSSVDLVVTSPPYFALRSYQDGAIESDRYTWRANHLRATPAAVRFLSCEPLLGPLPSLDLTDIDWLIVGGESGPGARPMDIDWAAELVERCRDAGVAVFVKQLGSRWGRTHHDIDTFPPELQVREMPHQEATWN